MVASLLSADDRNGGFSARIGSDEARRQLRMSLGVVVMLSIGIASAAATVGSHPLAAKRDAMSMAPSTHLHAGSDAVGAKAI